MIKSCHEKKQVAKRPHNPIQRTFLSAYVHKAYSLGILSNVQEMGIAGPEGVPGIRDGIEL